ncbi:MULTISPECIES: hypothetical protein [Bacteroidales]|nr:MULTISPECIES: hypothetical protein [Bacteroidales]
MNNNSNTTIAQTCTFTYLSLIRNLTVIHKEDEQGYQLRKKRNVV